MFHSHFMTFSTVRKKKHMKTHYCQQFFSFQTSKACLIDKQLYLNFKIAFIM